MQRTKWTERKFIFDLPEGWMQNVLERLSGTGTRLRELTTALNDETASIKKNNWSIKEHIGHLSDLESLHEGRIDDLLARKEILRAADMNNAETNNANHNEKSIDELITNFIIKRKRFVSRMASLDDATQQFKSMHPRLQVMMRPVDVAYFTAEHDDHHLATIREIISSN